MTPARIAELLQPFMGPPGTPSLGPDSFRNILMYIDLLKRWNAKINLTAIRDEEQIVTRHFGESLFVARHLFPSEGRNKRSLRANSAPQREKPSAPEVAVADVGSGAGFPGIPIKLWAPEIHLTLIESNHKKATFLREVTRALTLTNVDIRNTRAETLAGITFDVVTLRAVERFESILPITATLLAPGARLALLIGESQIAQAHSTLPTLNWSRPIPIPGSESRILALATPSLGSEAESKQ